MTQDAFLDDLPEDFPKPTQEDLQKAFEMLALIQADFTTRPFVSAYLSWCRGTGPAVEDPQALLDEEGISDVWGGLTPPMLAMRDTYIEHLGHPVPTKGFIDRMAGLGPILEIGAGHGMLTHLINRAGGDSIATDLAPRLMAPKPESAWAEVLEMDAEDAVKAYPGRLVLCSWPGGADPYLTRAILAMQAGQRLVVIGEGPGGATGTSCFFELIGSDIIPESSLLDGASVWPFPGMKDRAVGFVKTA